MIHVFFIWSDYMVLLVPPATALRAYRNLREKTVFHEYLQEACFVLTNTEISEHLRKPGWGTPTGERGSRGPAQGLTASRRGQDKRGFRRIDAISYHLCSYMLNKIDTWTDRPFKGFSSLGEEREEGPRGPLRRHCHLASGLVLARKGDAGRMSWCETVFLRHRVRCVALHFLYTRRALLPTSLFLFKGNLETRRHDCPESDVCTG